MDNDNHTTLIQGWLDRLRDGDVTARAALPASAQNRFARLGGSQRDCGCAIPLTDTCLFGKEISRSLDFVDHWPLAPMTG